MITNEIPDHTYLIKMVISEIRAGIVSSGNAWERRSRSYFDSGNGTAFKPALGELYKKHPVCTKIRLFEIQNKKKILGRGTDPGAHTVWFPHFFF